MNEPIKAGDLAEIIRGALGDQGPNVGNRVTVGMTMGEHSQFGRIVRIHGQGLVTEYGGTGSECDIPAAWLRKLPPVAPAAPAQRQEVTA